MDIAAIRINGTWPAVTPERSIGSGRMVQDRVRFKEKRMSEMKLNVWSEPVPDAMRSAPLVFVTRWRIPKENHQRMIDLVTGTIGNWGMDTQRMQPGALFYSRTRHWFRPDPDGATEEWWFMDEYDSVEAFEAMQKNVRTASFSGPNAEKQRERHQRLLELMVPGTALEPVLYSEIESARIEFEPYKARAAALERAVAAGQHP